LEYASENDLTITAFLWATWLEEDADGINILIITPEREAQEERMKEYVKHASPVRMGSDGAPYYPTFILREAWDACTRSDAPITAGVHEVTKLKLIPALRDIIQKGDYIGKFDVGTQRPDGIVGFHFFTGLVSLAGRNLTMGVPVYRDAEGNNSYDIGKISTDEDGGDANQ